MSSLSLGSSHRSAMRLASASRALMFSSPSGPPWGSASQAYKTHNYSLVYPMLKKPHKSVWHSADAPVNMDKKGKTQRKRKCSSRGEGKHEITLLLLFIRPVQRPASWQWPAWHWLEPPICEQRCPLCQITNLSLASIGPRAACILGSAPGPCQPENHKQIIQNDKMHNMSLED